VGLANEEGATPKARSGKNSVDFPWGSGFPPPKANVGNYADSALHEKLPQKKSFDGYTDGYATTSPVGSFAPNTCGIYDLGGNVWEWCEDRWEPGSTERVVRGGCWRNTERGYLLSSSRHNFAPGSRDNYYGFRCVVSATAR
jgi:formylglycine-generating enzyme required for sulfatase activity